MVARLTRLTLLRDHGDGDGHGHGPSRSVARTAGRAHVTTAPKALLAALRTGASPSTVELTGAQRSAFYPQTAEDGSGVGPGSGGLAMIMVVSMAMYCQPGWPPAV
jgi:hypothetical protein